MHSWKEAKSYDRRKKQETGLGIFDFNISNIYFHQYAISEVELTEIDKSLDEIFEKMDILEETYPTTEWKYNAKNFEEYKEALDTYWEQIGNAVLESMEAIAQRIRI